MEVFCGNYKDYKLKKRIPWLRYIFIFMLVSGATAATPAMISYYWDGRNSEATLEVREAIRLVMDSTMPESMRRSAECKIFHTARRILQTLNDASSFAGKVGDDAKNYSKKLKEEVWR